MASGEDDDPIIQEVRTIHPINPEVNLRKLILAYPSHVKYGSVHRDTALVKSQNKHEIVRRYPINLLD